MEALPLALRSRMDLAADSGAPLALPLTPAGTTYTMAQEATWIDANHFALGRWDGSLGVFKFTEAPSTGPMVAKAVNAPDLEGVQMITSVGPGMFASSNDEDSTIIWTAAQTDWSDLHEGARLVFDQSYGVANSGAVVVVDGSDRYFAMGHANGWLSIWYQNSDSLWSEVAAIDLRAATPVNPFGLHNIRGVAALASAAPGPGFVVTGSEDGNLTVVRVPDGAIMSVLVYNPDAKRGINSLAVKDSVVLVTNCAVGPADSNLWAYQVDPATWHLSLIGKANLAANPAAPQVFNFDVAWSDGIDARFFCSTEEGLLWMGQCTTTAGLTIDGSQSIGSPALGSAICLQNGELVAAAYDIHEFLVTPTKAK